MRFPWAPLHVTSPCGCIHCGSSMEEIWTDNHTLMLLHSQPTSPRCTHVILRELMLNMGNKHTEHASLDLEPLVVKILECGDKHFLCSAHALCRHVLHMRIAGKGMLLLAHSKHWSSYVFPKWNNCSGNLLRPWSVSPTFSFQGNSENITHFLFICSFPIMEISNFLSLLTSRSLFINRPLLINRP